jgi:fructose-bisphosphate aldolase class II
MMDGSLHGRRQDASPATNTTSTSRAQVVRHGACASASSVEGELGCLGSLETMKGDKEDGHGADGAR